MTAATATEVTAATATAMPATADAERSRRPPEPTTAASTRPTRRRERRRRGAEVAADAAARAPTSGRTVVKIVLRDDVENLGQQGRPVDVADGYARNYLVPRGLAMKATKGVVKQAEAMRRNREANGRARSRGRGGAGRPADRSSASSSTPEPARAAGSSARSPPPTSPTRCRPRRGVEIDRRRIALDEPLKELGAVEVPVSLHTDVVVTLTVEVVPDSAPRRDSPGRARRSLLPATLRPAGSSRPRVAVTPRAENESDSSPGLWRREP